jgi:hypothetical protein
MCQYSQTVNDAIIISATMDVPIVVAILIVFIGEGQVAQILWYWYYYL